MTSTFRRSAVAFTLACSANLAMADAATIDFDSLKLGTQPVGVSTQFQSSGFLFSGAYAWSDAIMDPDPLANDPKPSTPGKGTYIVNRPKNSSAGEILISLRSDLIGKVFFQSISFNGYSYGDETTSPLTVTGLGGITELTRQLSNPGGSIAWRESVQATDFLETDSISSIRLSAGTAAFGIDDLTINVYGRLTDGSGPNPAPEPASYALVGLALLAAGAATRRRT